MLISTKRLKQTREPWGRPWGWWRFRAWPRGWEPRARRDSAGCSWVSIIGALISWFVWAYLTFFIGTKILPEPQTRANHGELLRTIGFASAPGLIQVLGIVPLAGHIVIPVASIWMLIAMVIAVRQALDYRGTGRAVGVCVIGWIFLIIIRVVILGLFR